MAKAEFPTNETLSDRGRAFVGLTSAIAACLIGNETSSTEFIIHLVNSTKQVFGFTELEANMAYHIGMSKGKDIQSRYHNIKK